MTARGPLRHRREDAFRPLSTPIVPAARFGSGTWRGFLAALLLLFSTAPAHAQESPFQVLPLEKVLRDTNGDHVPDRFGYYVTTRGRVTSPILGAEDGWKDFFIHRTYANEWFRATEPRKEKPVLRML